MIEKGIPFTVTDWNTIIPTKHSGERGEAIWKTIEFKNSRIRMVTYSPGYSADHWCNRGHILLVLKGQITTELIDGESVTLNEGMSYEVSDNEKAHRSSTQTGATLFIVD